MGSMSNDIDLENRRVYLDGLRKYKNKGIPVIIDGRELPEQEWGRIFDIQEDGSFYMGDFISRKIPVQESVDEMIDDESKERLVEIRFDRVYNK